MRYQQWMLAAVLGAAVLPGCKKEESTPNDMTPPAAARNDATPAHPADNLSKTANDALNSTKSGAQQATEGAKSAVENAKQSANSAVTESKGAMDGAAAEAQKKLDQVMEYVKENKLDLADKGLKELEDNKASLPQVIQDRLPTARKTLDAAKAGNATGLKLPTMNK